MASPAQVLVHNWRLKLAALGLSVFLWALVQTEPSNQETFATVPVHIQIADTSWTTSGAPTPPAVEVRLGGPARELIRLAREGTTLRVPIDVVGSRDSLVTLRREWVDLEPRSGVSVESVTPASVTVTFEPAQTRLVPLAARFAGSVREHLALATDIEVSPRLVRVHGAASRLEGLDSLPLMPFDLSELSRSGTFTVAIDTAGLLGASVVPPTATLGIRVEELVERVLDGIPVVAVVNPGESDVVAEPDQIQVRLSGARTVVTAFDPARLRAWVSPELLRGMEVGEERVVPIQIDGVPPLIRAEPEVDRITVRRAIDQLGPIGPRDPP